MGVWGGNIPGTLDEGLHVVVRVSNWLFSILWWYSLLLVNNKPTESTACHTIEFECRLHSKHISRGKTQKSQLLTLSFVMKVIFQLGTENLKIDKRPCGPQGPKSKPHH